MWLVGVICRGMGPWLATPGDSIAPGSMQQVHATAAANAEVGRVISTDMCLEGGNLTSHGLLEGQAGLRGGFPWEGVEQGTGGSSGVLPSPGPQLD